MKRRAFLSLFVFAPFVRITPKPAKKYFVACQGQPKGFENYFYFNPDQDIHFDYELGMKLQDDVIKVL